MRHTVRRLAALTLAAVILLPTSALASDDAPAHALGLSSAPQGPWTANLTDPLFSPAARWVPGDAETAGFWARNQSADETELRVQLTPQVDDPATYDHLHLRVRADGGAWEPFDTAWSTPHALAPGERTHVEIRATLPRSSTNASQGLGFSFSVGALLASTDSGDDRPPTPTPSPTQSPDPTPAPSSGPPVTTPGSDDALAPLPGPSAPSRTPGTPDGTPTPSPDPDAAPDAARPFEDGIDQVFWLPGLFATLAAAFWLVMLVRRRHDETEEADLG
ncbi:hypothetical protein IEQ44_14135 [Nocardioides sp. Y6]|uniref:Uncharacterized protein n=1 Tax=Nocardioides malaquae TaxID=2773426 RepID=A0ABR9RW80_9ACTN|nr:hypothetical protein [Nocardioides malaquae]MBE7325788.1 hypothetical protein [Nocardioides malaquae]